MQSRAILIFFKKKPLYALSANKELYGFVARILKGIFINLLRAMITSLSGERNSHPDVAGESGFGVPFGLNSSRSRQCIEMPLRQIH